MAVVLVLKMLPQDTTGGSPWVLLPGIVVSLATTILAIFSFLAAYLRPAHKAPRFWLASVIYVLGCAGVVIGVRALLDR